MAADTNGSAGKPGAKGMNGHAKNGRAVAPTSKTTAMPVKARKRSNGFGRGLFSFVSR